MKYYTPCPTTVIHTVFLIATLKGCTFVPEDARAASYGEAARVVYVKPAKKIKMRVTHARLLTIASYG